MKKFFLIAMCFVAVSLCGAKTVKRVACVGNSITKGSWLAYPNRDSYPADLQRMLGDAYKVDNWGLGGACVSPDCKNVYLASDTYKSMAATNPDIVTVLLGTDDSRVPNQAGISQFKNGLTKLVESLQSLPSHPKIFLITPPKARSVAYQNDDNTLAGRILPQIKEVAQGKNIVLIDVNSLTANDGKYYPDGIHPDENGAGHIAEIVCKAVSGKSVKYARSLSLPTIITSHAVLQQHTDVAIWGWGEAGKKVTVKPSWSKAFTAIPDAEGNWKLKIPTKDASYAKYSITISQNSQKIELSDILFGEVWLAAGQSNMQMELGGFYSTAVEGGPQAIAASNNDGLRLFRVPRADNARPQIDVFNKGWEVSSPASAVHFSATGYFFASNLQKILNIPVGVIESAYGGASIVSFLSPDVISQYSYVKDPDYKDMVIPKYWESYTWPKHTPTVIYNSMIKPILSYNLKGAIWYQGEDDRRHPDLYKKMFHSFMNDYHAKWQCGNWPIYYAQIAPYDYSDGSAALMREAQEQLESDKDSMFMIGLMDNGLETNIHPSDKPTVGFRFAQRVLDKTYHMEGINSQYPHFKSMEIRQKDGKVVLHFTGMDDGVAKKPYQFEGFQLAGKDKIFYNVNNVAIEGATLVITPPAGMKPEAVRYCWKDYQKGNVYNMRGLPLSSFRSDSWNDVK